MLLGLPCCMCALGAAFLGSLVVLAGGSSRTGRAQPLIRDFPALLGSLSSDFPGNIPGHRDRAPCLPQAPPAQLRQPSALHKPKELFCLLSQQFSVQRFKSGSIDLGSEGRVEVFGYMGSCFHSPSWTIYVLAGSLSLGLVYLFVRQALLNGVPVNFSSNKSKK